MDIFINECNINMVTLKDGSAVPQRLKVEQFTNGLILDLFRHSKERSCTFSDMMK